MQAKAILVTNLIDINEATQRKEDLGIGIDIPKEEYGNFDLLFNLEDVKFTYITPKHDTFLLINSDYFEIQYDEDVWNKLKERFK